MVNPHFNLLGHFNVKCQYLFPDIKNNFIVNFSIFLQRFTANTKKGATIDVLQFLKIPWNSDVYIKRSNCLQNKFFNKGQNFLRPHSMLVK